MKLVLSESATAGVDAIAERIALVSTTRALEYLNAITKALQALTVFPASYPVADPRKDKALRKRVFQNLTIILYKFDNETVYVEAILDAR